MSLNVFSSGAPASASEVNENFNEVLTFLFNPIKNESLGGNVSSNSSTDWVLIKTVNLASSDFSYGLINVVARGAFKSGGTEPPSSSALKIEIDDSSVCESGTSGSGIAPIINYFGQVSTGESHTVKLYIKKAVTNSYSGSYSYSLNTY
jgi:hypothetical protein